MAVYDTEEDKGLNEKIADLEARFRGPSASDDLGHKEGLGHSLSDEHADKKASPGALNNAEKNASSSPSGTGENVSSNFGGGFWSDSTSATSNKTTGAGFTAFLWGTRRRKQATVGGGAIGLLVGGGFLGLTIVSGPFQFIHIAQLLQHAHFSNQQDAGNDRMGKLYRFLRSGGNPGETRVGVLGNKMKNTMIGQLEDAGFEYSTDRAGNFTGFEIDTTNENSPFHNMDEQQVSDQLANGGVTNNVVDLANSDGKITVTPKNGFLNGYSNKSVLNKYLVDQTNESIIPDAIRTRVLAKYGMVTWHPLSVLDAKTNKAAYTLWEQAREKFLKTGQEPTSITTDGAQEETTDKSGKTTTTSASGENVGTTSTDVASTLESIKAGSSLKVAGGLAAAAGLVCAIKSVNDNIGTIRYAQDILPLMRMGSEAVTVGNQVMNGTDVDINELSILSQQFNSDGSNWANSQTFQADSGEPTTGADISNGVKDTLSESSPSWLSWVDSVPGVGTLCSTAGGIVTGVGSVVVGIFSGGIASTVVGGLVGAIAAGPVINELSHVVAGDSVNVLAGGAEWGNDINYGSRLFSNAGAVQDGGTTLSNSQVGALDASQDKTSQASFKSQSVAYRLFNPDDYRSLISKVIDGQSSNVNQNLNNVASSFLSLGHSIASMPLKLFSSVVHAAPSTTYNYPFAEFGFSLDDLNNPLVEDPYANADVVGKLLDSNNQNGEPDYITEAQQCFNVTISKDSGVWDVIPGASSSPDALNIYDSATYSPANCKNPPGFNQDDWLRVRFFIFDTGIMEGYACQHGDAQSCANDGFSNSSPASPSSSAPTIVLDPGHAPSANENVDPDTNEPVFDYENDPEMAQVWQVAQDLSTQLKSAGYNVIITKNSVDDTSTNLKQRAEVGNNASSALGVSIHTTPGSPTNGNDIFVPVTGEYLVKTTGQHDVYTNSALAATDLKDGTTMANDLMQTEPGTTFKTGGYDQIYGPITRVQDGITMQGTMLVTQYFATVPWLYAEQYQDAPGDAVSPGTLQKYEAGLLKGIEDIVPLSNSSASSSSTGNPQ